MGALGRGLDALRERGESFLELADSRGDLFEAISVSTLDDEELETTADLLDGGLGGRQALGELLDRRAERGHAVDLVGRAEPLYLCLDNAKLVDLGLDRLQA